MAEVDPAADKRPQSALRAIRPDKGMPSTLGTSFDYEFPPVSATIFAFPLHGDR